MKKKILVISTNLELNGISSVIMNYFRKINLNKYDITICCGKNINSDYYKECKKLGINIITLPHRKPRTIKYYICMYKSIKKNYFDIVHIHGNSSMMFIELLISYLKNIKFRIAHCHNNNCTNKFIHKLFQPIFKKLCSYNIACSNESGIWLYGKNNYTVIPNAFELDKFKYNELDRVEIRKKLGIPLNAFVLGHVGRFNKQKNQEFLINIMQQQTLKNMYLILVGDGPYSKKIKDMVSSTNLENKIIFCGETDEPYKYYSSMDLFLFPSKYEGFGLSLLEAQINGLYSIASINVPSEVNITGKVKFLQIDKYSINSWLRDIKRIKSKFNYNRNIKSNIDLEKYDINKTIKILEDIYDIK